MRFVTQLVVTVLGAGVGLLTNIVLSSPKVGWIAFLRGSAGRS